jgi:hypothetical protein
MYIHICAYIYICVLKAPGGVFRIPVIPIIPVMAYAPPESNREFLSSLLFLSWPTLPGE